MNFPNFFADAEASFEESEFILFGVPYDKTSSFRHGADRGPKKIREASWNFETYNIKTDVDLCDIKFHDYGDLDVKNDKPELMIEKTHVFTKKLLDKNKFPVALGGEHSITPGIVYAYPDDIAVLSLDAHIDFREEYENEKYNHACVLRRISDYIDIDNIAAVGIRSAEKEEFIEAKKQGLFYRDVFTIRRQGLESVLKETKKHLAGKKVYLTLDIDVIDPGFAPGTSTPEPFGLSPFDVLEFIDMFASQMIGFDVVEVCPQYDHGESSFLAAKFVRYVIDRVWSLKK